MGAWRSPLLYLGSALILIAVAAFVLPFFMNWERYRPTIEAVIGSALGQETVIDGAISAALFPWPVLRLGRVRITTPSGTSARDPLNVESLEVRVALASLLSGKIEIEGIKLVRPHAIVERSADGDFTDWSPPDDNPPTLNPDSISIKKMEISDGVLILSDGRHGLLTQLEDINATVTAPELSGPWRLRGETLFSGVPLQLSVSTGKFRPGAPLAINARVTPKRQAGLGYHFDGEINDGISGRLRIAPAPAPDGRENALTGLMSFVLETRLEAGFDGIALDQIEIAPKADQGGVNLVNGQANIKLGETIKIAAHLETAHFDLNTVLGSQDFAMFSTVTATELHDAITGFLSHLPRPAEIKADIELANLLVGEQSLKQVALRGRANAEGLIIDDLSATLPGHTETRVSGHVKKPGQKASAVFRGDFAVNSLSLHDFAYWSWPQALDDLTPVWRSVGGRFQASGNVEMRTADDWRTHGVDFALDEIEGSGELRIGDEKTPSLSLQLTTTGLDLDRYLASGMEIGNIGSVLLAQIDKASRHRQISLALESAGLTFDALQLRNISLALTADQGELVLQRARAGHMSGAQFEMDGRFLRKDEELTGKIKARVTANKPSARAGDGEFIDSLRQTFGLDAPEDIWPLPLRLLYPLSLEIVGELHSLDEAKPRLSGKIRGTVGPMQLSVDAGFDDMPDDWREVDLQASGIVESDSSRALAKWLAFPLSGSKDGPSQLAFSVQGALDDTLKAAIDLTWMDMALNFSGHAKTVLTGQRRIEGEVALSSQEIRPFLQALGIPPRRMERAPLSLSLNGQLDLDAADNRWSVTGIQGHAAGAAVNGNATLNTGTRKHLDIALSSTKLDLVWLMIAQLFQRDDDHNPTTDRTIRPAKFKGLDRRLTVDTDRLTIAPGVSFSPAHLTLTAKDTSFELKVDGQSRRQPAAMEFTLNDDGNEHRALEASASFSGALQLEKLLRDKTGKPVLSGNAGLTFKARTYGHTLAGLLVNLAGYGHYELDDARLTQLDLQRLGDSLMTIHDAADAETAIRASGGEGTDLPGLKGAVSISKGVVDFAPAMLPLADATGEIKLLADLIESKLELDLRVDPEKPSKIPRVDVFYVGPPDNLELVFDTNALQQYLAMQAMKDGLGELERLKKVQQRLLEEESRFQQLQAVRQRAREAAEKKRQEEQDRAAAGPDFEDVQSLAHPPLEDGDYTRIPQNSGNDAGHDSAPLPLYILPSIEDDGALTARETLPPDGVSP